MEEDNKRHDPLKPDPRGLLPEEIAAIMAGWGEPAFRGRQGFTWLQKEAVSSYQQMTNISKAARSRLEESLPLEGLSLVKRQESSDGTVKYLFALSDGQHIESVLMAHKEETGHIRHTVCLSSQVGCAMGCSFCATAGIGFRRNLSAGEIVSQLLEIAAQENKPIHNAVYMGMGEPMLNLEAVEKSIRILHHPLGQDIGARRITVSTCGLPDGIHTIAEWDLDIVLAVSLHAADDETRSRLMPANKRYPLETLIAACREYHKSTGKRITFEYIMIKGVNMEGDTAKRLGKLLQGIPCNINLIPVNPGGSGDPGGSIEESDAREAGGLSGHGDLSGHNDLGAYEGFGASRGPEIRAYVPPNHKAQSRFMQDLHSVGLTSVVRQERGRDIGGACGQLAGDAGLTQH